MATTLPYVTESEFFSLTEANSPSTAGEKGRIPMTPWVLIQFRTAVLGANQTEADYMASFTDENGGYDVARHSTWTTVSFRKATNSYTPGANPIDDIKTKGSLDFDNYFDNVDLEDNGGMISATLKLYDPNFGNLEHIILRSILSMKAANSFYDKNPNTDKYMLQFEMGGPQNVNFRIRYGYSDPATNPNDIIDVAEVVTDDAFAQRVKEGSSKKIVIRSQWHYFQMMDCKFSIAQGGMYAEVKGVSIGTSIFERLKIVQRYAMLRGTPAMLIEDLGKQLFSASSGTIQFMNEQGGVYMPDDTPENIKTTLAKPDANFKSTLPKDMEIMDSTAFTAWLTEEYGEGESEQKTIQQNSKANCHRIEIMYGPEPRPQTDSNGKVIEGTMVRDFMTVKSLLNTLVSKCPPQYKYEIDDKEKYVEDGDKIKKLYLEEADPVEGVTDDGGSYERSKFTPIQYGYKIMEMKVGEKTVIRVAFNYKRPAKDQEFVRKYTWRNNEDNLISAFSIASSFDFAQISSKIAIVNDGELSLYMGAPTSIPTAPEYTATGTPRKATDDTAEGSIQEDALNLVYSIHEDTEADGSANGEATKKNIAQQLIDNMNKQVFRGSIEIPGDPFYKFDANMQPYQYGIYIDVLRDFNFYQQDLNQPNQKSYMSGFYVIKKIKHSISKDGFKTTLEVDKWPTSTIQLTRS